MSKANELEELLAKNNQKLQHKSAYNESSSSLMLSLMRSESMEKTREFQTELQQLTEMINRQQDEIEYLRNQLEKTKDTEKILVPTVIKVEAILKEKHFYLFMPRKQSVFIKYYPVE